MSDMLPHEELLQISERLNALADEWKELDMREVAERLRIEILGSTELMAAVEFAERAKHQFDEVKNTTLSIIDLEQGRSSYIISKKVEVQRLNIKQFAMEVYTSESEITKVWQMLNSTERMIEPLKELSVITRDLSRHLQRKKVWRREIKIRI